MFDFLKQVGDYTRDAVDVARNLTQGLAVTFDHMKRRPVTVQYPYEKLIPSERYRGRIHYEFDKCIACEVCVRVCPINLPVVDWVMNKETKKKELRNYSIDFGVCIFCGNCVEYCPTNEMLADLFTKPLQGMKFKVFRNKVSNWKRAPAVEVLLGISTV